jgi:hypothetical protein
MTEQSGTKAMQFEYGDEITVMRGKHRNETATVVYVDPTNRQYAAKFADNAVDLINEVNVRTPEEPTITASQLAAILNKHTDDLPADLLAEIEKALPGIPLGITD